MSSLQIGDLAIEINGSGTESSPYEIDSCDKFVKIFCNKNNTNLSASLYFKLTQDLDFFEDPTYKTGVFFQIALPLYCCLFSDNKTIKGLTIYSQYFINSRGATIKKINFEDCSFCPTISAWHVFCAYPYKSSIIECNISLLLSIGSYVKGEFSSDTAYDFIGCALWFKIINIPTENYNNKFWLKYCSKCSIYIDFGGNFIIDHCICESNINNCSIIITGLKDFTKNTVNNSRIICGDHSNKNLIVLYDADKLFSSDSKVCCESTGTILCLCKKDGADIYSPSSLIANDSKSNVTLLTLEEVKNRQKLAEVGFLP